MHKNLLLPKKQEKKANSFTSKLVNENSDNLFLVTGKNLGKDAWYYILVDNLKVKLFERDITSNNIELSKYGEILYSGWGAQPPEYIKMQINIKFGIKNDSE